jgi:transketolase
MQANQLATLQQAAHRARQDVLRSIHAAGSGHLASSLGAADIFTYFYHHVLRLRPQQPQWQDRDLFLLSAGHLCPIWYVTLAHLGFFDPQLLLTLRHLDSPLQGHPQRQITLGIENSAGSLGQGISQAAGLAYALQQAQSDRRVFVLSSDGEQQEGQVWEAYLFAAHYHLHHLTVIIDLNDIQQSGRVGDVMNLTDLKTKLLSFNWAVGVCHGNDFASIDKVWQQIKDTPYPHAIICRTTAGQGVSFMSGDYRWHAQTPNSAQWAQAFQELGLEPPAPLVSQGT